MTVDSASRGSASRSPYIVTLGTAGGPRLWDKTPRPRRFGISTAVVVDGASYVVDFGRGALTQFYEAGLDMATTRAVFLTHLHSDHTVDLMNWLLFGWVLTPQAGAMHIYGPGDRGELVPVNHNAAQEPELLFPEEPVNGTKALVRHIWAGSSADVNERMRDSLYADPRSRFIAHDIEIPTGIGYHPNTAVAPTMEPFEIYRDEHVVVTAILVDHQPMAPAFAFRFDTVKPDAEGETHAVTISGDTTYCANTARLARGSNVLLHEAIDMEWVAERGSEMDNPENAKASVEHHKKAHCTPEDAGRVATEAGVGLLALHHLVPGHAHQQAFAQAASTFAGPVLIPEDLEVIEF